MKYLLIFLLTACLTATSYGQSRPDSVDRRRVWLVAGTGTAIYGGGLGFLGLIWYRDKEQVPLHFYDDSKGYLQMDKWGHAYAAYHISRASYESLRWAGLSERRALAWGAPVGLIFQTPIEVFDGLYEGWGFSWPDMAANAAGPALFAGQQLLWGEQMVTMKFSYAPSGYPDYHSALGETPLESFFMDYNAHTYWLSGNLSRVSRKVPRWLNLALGYSANGMIREFENPRFYQGEPFPNLPRYLQWLLSPDIDFTRIPSRKPWVRTLLFALNLLKVPAPALEYNRISGFKAHWLYW